MIPAADMPADSAADLSSNHEPKKNGEQNGHLAASFLFTIIICDSISESGMIMISFLHQSLNVSLL